MGTQVHCKSYLPGYYSMRDLNDDSNSSSWPLFYGDKTLTSAQYYNGYIPRTITDAYLGYDKDQLKQKMLEHEAVFKKQVYELHRLYRIQRDMMDEFRRKELNKRQMSMEPSSSSSLLGSQRPSEDAGKWHIASFPLANSGYPRPSVSGAEIVNSPLSCTKGNTVPAGRVNGCASKDCEVLEARPSKVRKKLFDLQLPADEYIDTEDGEQLNDGKIIEVSSSLPNGNHRKAPENHDKFFPNGGVGEKLGYQSNASASDSCTRGTVRLADLNEPVQLEDIAVASSVEFLGKSANHGESRGLNLSAKPSSGIHGLQKEIMNNAYSGNHNVTMTSVGSRGNERDWLSGVYESGQRKNNSIPQGFQKDKLPMPSQPAQLRVNNTCQPVGILPIDCEREERWKERATCGLENLDRVHNNSDYNHLESVMTSQVPKPYTFGNSSDFASSWSHSALSWGKPTSSFPQKLNSFHPYPSIQASSILSKSSQSSAQSHGGLVDKWHNNERSCLTPGMRSDVPTINGFYHGSSSGSKEVLARYPSVNISHLDCNKSDNMASICCLDHGPGELSNGCTKPAKDMDLNAVQTKCSSSEDVVIINDKSKPGDHLAALPWLRAKPCGKSETANVRRDSNSESFSFFQSSPSILFCEGEPLKDLNEMLTQKERANSSDCEVGIKKESRETQGIKKILGVPIFEKPSNLKNESSSSLSTSVSLPRTLSGEKVEMEAKNRLIDINLAFDEQLASEDLAVEKVMDTKVARVRNVIDLNSCVTEDEELLAPSGVSNSESVKIAVEIDLEAPVLETEDDVLAGEDDKLCEASLQPPEPEVEEANDEVIRIAAEAIVSLSSSNHLLPIEENTCQPTEDPLAECLLWFADAVSSCADKHNGPVSKEIRGPDSLVIGNYSSDEMDDFEVMTLQLQETKEEDYMPKPFVPEVQKIEESGPNSVPNRSRKGQTRRGRQRRDFQRDILPGLASLSRHEVTEDLQTFGGLMRATGHPWSSGLTRRNGTRNGGGRGRRRAVVVEAVSTVVATATCTPLMQQLNNIEAGLEDRSLTGWGKTTRRPRRQRCPAGNPTPATLT
ncbi:uncharacterized protein [Coffea arabica]|uniref:Uncharacterized protein isoform X2 n=1 Tax=Coffea arabica TaxID=13443 RepID=A0A6P6VB24_COFAR|nr:uncharacterized protein LOC113719078 isoform X2 [Coffea arabica]